MPARAQSRYRLTAIDEIPLDSLSLIPFSSLRKKEIASAPIKALSESINATTTSFRDRLTRNFSTIASIIIPHPRRTTPDDQAGRERKCRDSERQDRRPARRGRKVEGLGGVTDGA